MVIDFSKIGVIKEQPTLVLCNADGTAIQTLGYAFNLQANICYNEVSTITFDIPAYVDGVATPHYDDIIGMRIIDMLGWGRFILVNPAVNNDGVSEIKSCKAYSLEYELTYKKTFFDEATYNLWNPLSPDETVLGTIIKDLPSWNIGTVDSDLIGKYRTFSVTDENVYNFMKSTLQETYSCIFDFDTYTRTINVRSTSNEAVTKPVYLSMENLVKEIDIDEDTENIYTVLDVNGGEDVDIRIVNPLGTNKIYNLDYFMNTSHFEQALVDKWNQWKSSLATHQLTYYNISIERMLKTSAILTEEAALNDLENIELASLESERSVYVEHLAQLSKSSDEYDEFQDKLDDVNDRIDDKEDEIASQKEKISVLKEEETELKDSLLAIQSSVAFNKFFTNDELIILDRYFKEEAIEESSFVVSEVSSYSDSDISNKLLSTKISFANCELSKVTTDNDKTIYNITDGKLTLTSSGATLTANVVNACFEINEDESIVLSAFLNKGSIGDATFPSGCISLTGTGAYATTSGSTSATINIANCNLYFTRNTTDYERYSVSFDLYQYGVETLASLAYPSYSFDVSSGNFMSVDDFAVFVKQLELGQKIYLNTDNKVLTPIFIGIEIDFEKLDSLSLQFSDKYSSSDSAFKIVDLLDQSISMGKKVDTNKMSYAAFVDSGASTKVKEFMDSALDVAKNAILSSSGQGVAWDETGLHLRKYIDSSNPDAGYDDEQIWMINNNIVFTDDGWQTAKMAIGKIIDENIAKYPETSDIVFNPEKDYYYMDNSGEYQIWNGTEDDWTERPILYEKDITAYGIVAPYIVGTMLAGENLVITTEDGSFKVDSSGVHIDSMKFFITHDEATYDTTLEEELKALKAKDDESAQGLADAIEEINSLNTKVENTVTTLYQDTIPENTREGDLWYVTGDIYNNPTDNSEPIILYPKGKLYRYNGEAWDEITDADAIAAIEKANNAQATADGKITSYYQDYAPANPSHGDLWFNNATADSKTRTIEDGDDLSGMMLYFDTSQLLTDAPHTEIIRSTTSSHKIGIGNVSGVYGWSFRYNNGSNATVFYDIDDTKWYRSSFQVSSNFGVATSVDKTHPFYSLITATFKNKYPKQKLYRYDETQKTWLTVEDGDIEIVKSDISDITKTLGEYITEEGYLTANKLQGAINTTLSTMYSAEGNVVFDDKGMWLLNTSSKETATTAIWINEMGILFGKGNSGINSAGELRIEITDENDEDYWGWTTAIGHDGIIADAMATKTLSAFTIDGGSISIGDGAFTVNTNGVLYAKSGTFKGTLEAATLKGDIKASTDSDTWLMGCGLSIGGDADKYSGNFYVDTEGNVTMKGNINLSGGTITWSSANTPVQVRYSADGSSWHTSLQDTDYYAQYSYDGGTTWTGTVQIRGEKGEQGEKGDTGERGPRGYSGSDGSDAEVTFANVNAALGTLFKTWTGGTPTTISSSYIYSPEIKGGFLYGSKFYAGSGDGFSQMDANGFTIYDEDGNKKIGIGCYSGAWDYPYVVLGVGTGTNANGSGLVMKLGSGIWIGDSTILAAGGDYPGGRTYAANISSSYPNATGIFIAFDDDTVYRYICGVPTEISSSTAKFG